MTPPRQIAPEKLHGPFLCLLTKFALLVIFSRVNITFFFGGGKVLENERSESLLLSFNNSNAQLIIDRGKPLPLYPQKPHFARP